MKIAHAICTSRVECTRDMCVRPTGPTKEIGFNDPVAKNQLGHWISTQCKSRDWFDKHFTTTNLGCSWAGLGLSDRKPEAPPSLNKECL